MIYQLIGRFASYNDFVNHSFMFVRLTHQRSRTFKSTSKIQLQFINDDSFATISYGMHCNTQPRRSFLTIFVSGEVSYIFLCVIHTIPDTKRECGVVGKLYSIKSCEAGYELETEIYHKCA